MRFPLSIPFLLLGMLIGAAGIAVNDHFINAQPKVGGPPPAQPPRQFYTLWERHSKSGYYYTRIYYKAEATATDYLHHYAIYYPNQGNKAYFFDPEKQLYWGYYDFDVKGFAMLPAEKRRAKLADIPADSYSKAGEKIPVLPGVKDAATTIPPQSLPQVPKEDTRLPE